MKYIYNVEDLNLLEQIIEDYCIPQPENNIPHYTDILRNVRLQLKERDTNLILTNNMVIDVIQSAVLSMIDENIVTNLDTKEIQELRPVIISIYERFILSVRDSMKEKSLYSSFINSTVTKPQAERLIKRLFSLYRVQEYNENHVDEHDLLAVLNVLDVCGDVTVLDIVNMITPILISDENPQSSAWLSTGFQVYLPRMFGYDMFRSTDNFTDLGDTITKMELGMLSPYYDINLLLFNRSDKDSNTLHNINPGALTFSPNTMEVISSWKGKGYTHIHDILSKDLQVKFYREYYNDIKNTVMLSFLAGRELQNIANEMAFTFDGSKLNLSPVYKFVYLAECAEHKAKKKTNEHINPSLALCISLGRFAYPVKDSEEFNAQELREPRLPRTDFIASCPVQESESRKITIPVSSSFN